MTTPPRRRWFSFSLRTLFVLVALAACLFWFGAKVWEAHYAAMRSAYGNQRMTRWQAETINRRAKMLPDSEFRQTDNPSDALPQRGQPWP